MYFIWKSWFSRREQLCCTWSVAYYSFHKFFFIIWSQTTALVKNCFNRICMITDRIVNEWSSPRYPSQWRTMRTPEKPESHYCPGPVDTATPPPQNRFPLPPIPQTTHCSGGRACSGHDGWAGRGVGVPARPRVVREVQRRGSVSRDWPCSGAQRGRNLTLWCEREWNIWVCLQLGSVSVQDFAVIKILLLISNIELVY